MKTAGTVVALAAMLLMSNGVLAAPPTNGVTYDQAIQCAAVDTLASAVLDGEDASVADKGLSAQYDAMIEHWVAYAASLTNEKKALADYEAAATRLTGQATEAKDDAELEALLGTTLKVCAALEESVAATIKTPSA